MTDPDDDASYKIIADRPSGLTRSEHLAHFRDSMEYLHKAVSYLAVAHSAGLVSSLTFLKDYDNTPKLKGVGAFILIFGLGLICATINYVLVSLFRFIQIDQQIQPSALTNVAGESISATSAARGLFYMCMHLTAVLSFGLFLSAVVLIVVKYHSL